MTLRGMHAEVERVVWQGAWAPETKGIVRHIIFQAWRPVCIYASAL